MIKNWKNKEWEGWGRGCEEEKVKDKKNEKKTRWKEKINICVFIHMGKGWRQKEDTKRQACWLNIKAEWNIERQVGMERCENYDTLKFSKGWSRKASPIP